MQLQILKSTFDAIRNVPSIPWSTAQWSKSEHL